VVNTPAEARAYVDAEMARWERVLREAGVRPLMFSRPPEPPV
jgi:tripartite-type tricarboxylate transporter receptor subunit TctC